MVAMSPRFKYQVAILDAGGGGLASTLTQTLRRHVAELGLSPDDDIECFGSKDIHHIEYDRVPVAAVFFGGADRLPEADAAASELRRRGVFVLPVVPALTGYTSFVPNCLHP